MKSLLSVCLVAGSTLAAGSSLISSSHKIIPGGEDFFTCNVNGNTFAAITNDSSLTTKFTYADNQHIAPAALFMDGEQKAGNNKSYFNMQPINDDAPAAPLTVETNLYQDFYITYKAADNTFYNTTTAPGNLEITSIDTMHKIITGKLNCILYSSAKKDWMIVTDGRFRLKF